MTAFFGTKAAARLTEPGPSSAQHILFGRGFCKASKVGTKKALVARESILEGFVRAKKLTSKNFCMNTTCR